MRHPTMTGLLTALLLVTLTHGSVAQEDFSRDYPTTSATSVALAFRVGAVASTPRGTFPSVIIGESRRPVGQIGQEYGRSSVGPTLGLSLLVPFSESLGGVIGFGTSVLEAGYSADTSRGELIFKLQTVDIAAGVEWSVLRFDDSYRRGGLRSVQIGAGLDIAAFVASNRLEGPYFGDTVSQATRGVGSFTSGEPFRTGIALAGTVGMRFAATVELELVTEAKYSYSLNPVFSSEAVSDNEFSLDRFTVVAGVGWRF